MMEGITSIESSQSASEVSSSDVVSCPGGGGTLVFSRDEICTENFDSDTFSGSPANNVGLELVVGENKLQDGKVGGVGDTPQQVEDGKMIYDLDRGNLEENTGVNTSCGGDPPIYPVYCWSNGETRLLTPTPPNVSGDGGDGLRNLGHAFVPASGREGRNSEGHLYTNNQSSESGPQEACQQHSTPALGLVTASNLNIGTSLGLPFSFSSWQQQVATQNNATFPHVSSDPPSMGTGTYITMPGRLPTGMIRVIRSAPVPIMKNQYQHQPHPPFYPRLGLVTGEGSVTGQKSTFPLVQDTYLSTASDSVGSPSLVHGYRPGEMEYLATSPVAMNYPYAPTPHFSIPAMTYSLPAPSPTIPPMVRLSENFSNGMVPSFQLPTPPPSTEATMQVSAKSKKSELKKIGIQSVVNPGTPGTKKSRPRTKSLKSKQQPQKTNIKGKSVAKGITTSVGESQTNSSSKHQETGNDDAKRKCVVCLRSKVPTYDIYEENIQSSEEFERTTPKIKDHISTLLAQLPIISTKGDPATEGICSSCMESLETWCQFNLTIRQFRSTINSPERKPPKAEDAPLASPAYKQPPLHPPEVLQVKGVYDRATHASLSRRCIRDWNTFYSLLTRSKNGVNELKQFVMDKEMLINIYCNKCNRMVKNGRKGFVTHCKANHRKDDILFPCDICGDHLPDLNDNAGSDISKDYFSHWVSHFYLHVCENCGEKFPTEEALTQHNGQSHPEEQQETNTESNSKMSVKKDHGLPWMCDKCQVSFARKATLEKHSFKCHIKSAEEVGEEISNDCFKCGQCLKSFTTNYHLQRHVTNVHVTGKPFVCTTCGKAFKQKYTLKRHEISQHTPGGLQCPVCEEKFRSTAAYYKHKKSHKQNIVCKEVNGRDNNAPSSVNSESNPTIVKVTRKRGYEPNDEKPKPPRKAKVAKLPKQPKKATKKEVTPADPKKKTRNPRASRKSTSKSQPSPVFSVIDLSSDSSTASTGTKTEREISSSVHNTLEVNDNTDQLCTLRTLQEQLYSLLGHNNNLT